MLRKDTLFILAPAFAQIPLKVSNAVLMGIYLFVA